jgi:GNAT superfamily N-acetyltransferase
MLVRSLNANDWKSYRDLRLEALKLCADRYTGTYAMEAGRSEQDWRDMMSGEGHQCFGLFDSDRMVGLAAVFTDRSDASGKKAFLASAYIREDYRGQGYARLLYQHRIQWAIDSDRFDLVEVGHRQGNEASRRANQSFGFEWKGKEVRTFGDGRMDELHVYEVRLR